MHQAELAALGLYFLTAALVVLGLLVVSWFLGERHQAPGGEEPYESGIPAQGDARVAAAPQFYLAAAGFLVFDVEAALLALWAAAARPLGWPGYVVAFAFVATLCVALFWFLRVGALESGPGSGGSG